ncbi:hypothetical protein R1flu_003691 [Riccia fluitans]|uniref:Uncharacterized protein n=1 Tax=Riccia fluitans TaxID=41844 RepID=A0ABD1Y9R9_9MARC
MVDKKTAKKFYVYDSLYDVMQYFQEIGASVTKCGSSSSSTSRRSKQMVPDNVPSEEVPVAAAVYYEDMYVSFKLSDASAAKIRGIRTWVTNDYMHSGIREDGPRLLDHLFGLLKGKVLLR